MEESSMNIPGYEILDELGRGGMGIVYKAQDLKHDRPVALKMILSGRGANLLELARFRIEAEAIGSLAHPNIVLIHEVGVHLGFPFFVLEYAEGGSLAGRIRAQSMPCDWTAHICLKLALAMDHAHERGIIHRDLKPSNVLLMSADIPKVTDFGLAKFTTGDEWENDVRQGVTIVIPEVFQQLTELRSEFRGNDQDAEDRTDDDPAKLMQKQGRSDRQIRRCLDSMRALTREETAEQMEEDRREDRSSSFQEFVIRSLWKKQIWTPDIEDDQRLDAMRQFIQEALRQGSMDSPKESFARQKLTKSGAIMGTPQYMAPEQARGWIEEVGPSADVYSVGAIMYEMLTGRPPFTGDAYQVLSDVRKRPPVPPRQLRSSLDPGLEAICMKCLAKSAERRYDTMRRLAEDLQRYLEGAEVSAIRETSSPGQPLGDPIDSTGTATTKTWVTDRTAEADSKKSRSWWRFWR
jgi:serine/threonine protein kinase